MNRYLKDRRVILMNTDLIQGIHMDMSATLATTMMR